MQIFIREDYGCCKF